MSRRKPDTVPGPVGRNVKYLRDAHGWSQRYLAAMVAVTKGTIYQIEVGVVYQPKGALLHRLAEALGVPPVLLLGEDRPPVPSKPGGMSGGIKANLSPRQIRAVIDDLGAFINDPRIVSPSASQPKDQRKQLPQRKPKPKRSKEQDEHQLPPPVQRDPGLSDA